MKPTRPFRFKRFEIVQQRAAMKVGTDGVLLGAWCTVGPQTVRVLDIGAGTGLIALMLAQRGEATSLQVDAVEPEPGAYLDALENARSSPWAANISVRNLRLQDFRPAVKYDLIVCNPPYFTESLLPASPGRRQARHDLELSRSQLAEHAARLSTQGARFSIVIPSDRAGEYIVDCGLHDFSPARRTDIRTSTAYPVKRTLLEFVFRPQKLPEMSDDELMIETAPLEYTAEYRHLTCDFYLNF
ncbi:MAG: methyltransferase [Rikenellaceae bacterium]|nr:methyltransferase [Rikenellaceae bacterium]